jgi:TolA-binding protein
MKKNLIPLIFSLLPMNAANAENISVQVQTQQIQETIDRQVDLAALSSQNLAVEKLEELAVQYRNSPQEPQFLMRLATIYQQKAAIEFRLAHSSQKTPITKVHYDKTLRAGIQSLNRLISHYPSFPQLDHAYFLRAQSHQELENKESAKKDYLYLVKNHKNSPHRFGSYMQLAEYAIEESQHALAVHYLEEVEKSRNNPHYPFALHKLAWSHYNLGGISTALSYLEKHIQHYDERIKNSRSPLDSDLAIRENSLLDVALFYLEGHQENPRQYSVAKARTHFNSLSPGYFYGRMISRFGRLLKAHTHTESLEEWKTLIVRRDSHLPESLDVINTVFEHHHEQGRFNHLPDVTKDIVDLIKKRHRWIAQDNQNEKHQDWVKAYEVSQKLLHGSAEEIQKRLLENKLAYQHPEFKKRRSLMLSLYDGFIAMIEPSDVRVAQIYYNLGETLFQLEDYPRATEHYRKALDWISQNEKMKSDGRLPKNASLKAISSRYQEFQAQSLFAEKIEPIKSGTRTRSRLSNEMKEWISWIDEEQSAGNIEIFHFEANRLLYTHNEREQSIERLLKFSRNHLESPYAIPSLSLVLDTLILDENWKQALDLSREFLSRKELNANKFKETLLETAGNSSFKILEEEFGKKNFLSALGLFENFQKEYGSHSLLSNALLIASRSAVALGNEELAIKHLNQLTSKFQASPEAASAHITRANLLENQYAFLDAAESYAEYLRLTGGSNGTLSKKETGEIREQVLFLNWLAMSDNGLKAALANRAVCPSSNYGACQKYDILSRFRSLPMGGAETRNRNKVYTQNSIQTSGETRALWAAYALEHQRALPFPDRNVLIHHISRQWKDLDPLFQMTLLPRLNETIPIAFDLNRRAIRLYNKLQADEARIERRIKLMTELEQAATRALEFPSYDVQALVLESISGTYFDFSEEMGELAAQVGAEVQDGGETQRILKTLAQQFGERGNSLLEQSFQIARQKPLQLKNQTLILAEAKKRLGQSIEPLPFLVPSSSIQALTLELIAKDSKSKQPLLKAWGQAIKADNAALARYFYQAMGKEKNHGEIPQSLLRSTLLESFGMQAEALEILEGDFRRLEQDTQKKVALILSGHHLNAQNRASSQKWLNEFLRRESFENLRRLSLSSNEVFTILAVSHATQTPLKESAHLHLLSLNLQDEKNRKKDERDQMKTAWLESQIEQIKIERGVASHESN